MSNDVLAVEGSLINGLDRADEYKPDGTDSVKQQKSSNEQIKSHDDYILHKLFKRSGIVQCLHLHSDLTVIVLLIV